MRTRLFAIAFTALAVSPTLFAEQQTPPESFDFAKINATIKAAMEPAITGSQEIQQFTYEFDGSQTDVSKDRYAVNLGLTGKTPWDAENFTANAKMIFDHDAEGRKGIIKIASEVDISTDTLAFIRHHTNNLAICEKAAKATGLFRVVLTEKCKVAPRLAKVQSIDELQQIFREHLDSVQTAIFVYRSDLKDALAVVTGDLSKESLALQIKEAEDLITSTGAAQVQRTQDGVHLSAANLDLMGFITGVTVEATITPKSIHMKCSGTTEFGTTIFLAAKPELIQLLHDLEKGESYTEPMIQLETRFWMRLIEDHISGHIR